MDAKELLKRYGAGKRIFRGANLYLANLSGMDLSGTDLSSANLSGANLSGANLSGVDLWDADLCGANLDGANLSGANLDGADLWSAMGVTALYGAGMERRMIFVYRHAGFIRFQLGCFNGTYDEAITAIKGKYDNIELRKYLASYLASIEALKLTLEAQYE